MMARQAGRTGLRATLLAMGFTVFAGSSMVSAETLADALVSAYRNSNLLEQNRAVLRAADEDAAQAIAAMRPVVSFVAESGYARTPLTRAHSASLTLSTSLTLWDNGRNRLALEVARATIMATRQSLVGVEQDVLLSAVSAYFQVRAANEAVAINENSARVIGEELRAARDRFDVGEVTRTDVSQAEASLASAQASLASAQGDLAVAREAYKAATGHYPGTLAAAPPAPNLPKTLEAAKLVGQRNHPSILEAQGDVEVANLQIKLANANRGPSLSASISNGLDEEGDDSFSAGLDLSQTLYSGGSRASLHRQAIAGRDQAQAALLQAGVTVGQSVGEAWSTIDVSRATISATNEQIRAARIAYNGVREEASLGARTTLDVLDAEQDLLDAQNSLITAQANQQIAFYSLLSSMGLLTVKQLNLGIPTYDPEAYYNSVKNAPITSPRGEKLDRVLKAIGKQ